MDERVMVGSLDELSGCELQGDLQRDVRGALEARVGWLHSLGGDDERRRATVGCGCGAHRDGSGRDGRRRGGDVMVDQAAACCWDGPSLGVGPAHGCDLRREAHRLLLASHGHPPYVGIRAGPVEGAGLRGTSMEELAGSMDELPGFIIAET
jgi:hypothetical protein